MLSAGTMFPGPEIRIIPENGWPALLELQKLSYTREALLYNDFSIPPMVQTIESLKQELSGGTAALGLYLGSLLAGSARGYLAGGTVYIGRVIVHPDHWRKGFGRLILQAVENHFNGAARAELFTGSKSLDNVRFYSGCGYEIFKTGRMGDNITLLYFQKDLGR
jgi:GNAT superfamily N-acetyltransferase